ncbi:MAG TPA: hypothetical protein VIV13_03165 [Solirubrobacterales bacterium]
MSKPIRGQGEGGLDRALSHPIRLRILSSMQELGTSSPIRFARSTRNTDHEVDLNAAAYHFGLLDSMEVIEIAGRLPRQGTAEHIYRINPRSPVSDMLRATKLLKQVQRRD